MAQSRPTPQRFSTALMGESRKPGAQTMSSAAPLDAPSTSTPEMGGSGKTNPTAAGYQSPDQGPFECDNCEHFQAPNACEIVSGAIDAKGCCNNFEQGTPQSQSGGQ